LVIANGVVFFCGEQRSLVSGDVPGLHDEGNGNGQIAMAGNAIAFSGTTFGAWMQDPENTSELLIQLHSNAMVLAVQALATVL